MKIRRALPSFVIVCRGGMLAEWPGGLRRHRREGVVRSGRRSGRIRKGQYFFFLLPPAK